MRNIRKRPHMKGVKCVLTGAIILGVVQTMGVAVAQQETITNDEVPMGSSKLKHGIDYQDKVNKSTGHRGIRTQQTVINIREGAGGLVSTPNTAGDWDLAKETEGYEVRKPDQDVIIVDDLLGLRRMVDVLVGQSAAPSDIYENDFKWERLNQGSHKIMAEHQIIGLSHTVDEVDKTTAACREETYCGAPHDDATWDHQNHHIVCWKYCD